MGTSKQLLPFKNTTLLEHAVKNAQATKARKVYCVLGAHSKEIKDRVKTGEVTFIENRYWQEGLSASIVAGITYIQSVENVPDAVLIMLADQPFVDSNYMDSLIEAYHENQDSIIASAYDEKNGVPAIFSKRHFESLLKLKGDKGAKQLLNSEGVDVISIAPKRRNTLLDIDTPDDYNTLLDN